jgi:ubiquinone/menaquinone biosynthesis C-methylase UbiE
MAFVPEPDVWMSSHLNQIPNEVIRFCGDISESHLLDVGCGDMLADFGMLNHGVKRVTGLDVYAHPWDVVARTAKCISDTGVVLPHSYSDRLRYVAYNGLIFPFPDNSFDLVYSWSAFEHIPDVPGVLKEIRRVVKPDGRVFLQVYPWFHSYAGSHLSDYIDEPFFHLSRPADWVHQRLSEYCGKHPENAEFIMGHMWKEYQTLNKYSARMFLSAILAADFYVERMESILRTNYLDQLPPGASRADAMAAGTLVLLRPAK